MRVCKATLRTIRKNQDGSNNLQDLRTVLRRFSRVEVFTRCDAPWWFSQTADGSVSGWHNNEREAIESVLPIVA